MRAYHGQSGVHDMSGRSSKNTELGDQASFCVSCGWARRFYPGVVEAPECCPDCGSAVLHRCPACDTPVSSIMAVECEDCRHELRSASAAGVKIRRAKRMPVIDG